MSEKSNFSKIKTIAILLDSSISNLKGSDSPLYVQNARITQITHHIYARGLRRFTYFVRRCAYSTLGLRTLYAEYAL